MEITYKAARDLVGQFGCSLTRIDESVWRVNFKGAHESAASDVSTLVSAVEEAARRNLIRMASIVQDARPARHG